MDVLVVDDDVISRRIIEHILSDDGYNVTTACDGLEAFSLLQQHPFQLVVSDWHMPGMDGTQLCREIRNSDLRRYVYFVMVTSRDRSTDTMSGFATGVDDYVVKPFNPNELLMRVNAGRRIVQLEASNMTIFALAKLAEARDSETGQHLERVQSYCRVLSRYLQTLPEFQDQIDDEFVNLIYRTSPLHDIGKVAIPDSILLKEGKLTLEEFEVMKTHTTLGAETINSLLKEFPNAQFLQMARDIVLSHHEKYNGTGYPLGLVGEQIPLCGRIVALADVYDALTSKRVYKDAFHHDKAMSIIVGDSGTHFDPAVVEALLAVEDDFRQICHRFSDNRVPDPESIEAPALLRFPQLSQPEVVPAMLHSAVESYHEDANV